MKDWAVTLLVVVVSVVQAKPSGHHGGVSEQSDLPTIDLGPLVTRMIVSSACSTKPELKDCEARATECMTWMNLSPGSVGEPDIEKLCPMESLGECFVNITKCFEYLLPGDTSKPVSNYDTLCATKDVPNCEAKAEECLAFLHSGPKAPTEPISVTSACGTESSSPHCRNKYIDCVQFLQADPSQNNTHEVTPEPQPGAGAVDFQELLECSALLNPGPAGLPDVDTVCATADIPNCPAKYWECVILLTQQSPQVPQVPEVVVEDVCMGADNYSDCKGREVACEKVLEPTPAFVNKIEVCVLSANGFPGSPEAQKTIKRCMKPHMRAHLEAVDNAVVKQTTLESLDSCFENYEFSGVSDCITKSCIPVVSV